VKFRLVLAGVDAKQFRLTGAKQTIVTEIDEPITLRKVLASAEWALRQKHPGDTAKLTIAPAGGLALPLVDMRAKDRVQFEGKVSSWNARTGKARVDVSIVVNGKTRNVVVVHLDSVRMDAVAGPKDLGVIPAGKFNPTLDAADIVVKNRDLVRIVARIGAARIEAGGEAMEDGSVGATIRVRNTESNRVVLGRVEARGLVAVDN
jgi:flagella basal body P-ring formation protein FlgA